MTVSVPDDRVLFPAAAETALEPPGVSPPWLAGLRWASLDGFEADLADITGQGRDLRWRQADMCAAAWLQAGGGEVRHRFLRRLGSVLMCSARTAERRVMLGLTYPPELRMPDVSQRVYLAALKAADPCAVIRAALQHGWSARQVLEHIDTGRAPTERETVLDLVLSGRPDPEDAADRVFRALCTAAASGTDDVLEQHIRIVFVRRAM